MVELAKATGTWEALDDVEAMRLPPALKQALAANPQAAAYFEAFPPSAKKGILQWIQSAKRDETRTKRIQQTVELAAVNKRANSWPRPD